MRNDLVERGREELRSARRESRPLFWAVGLFSFFANLLMLTGPMYMLQVYDRVLSSRSEATLVALSLLVLFLYAMMGIMDYARGRIMGRVAAAFQSRLDRRVFDAVLRRSALKSDEKSQTGLADLEAVQRLMGAPVLMSIFDMPWTPIFLGAIFVFHPWLGILALAGGAVLICFALLNQLLSRGPNRQAGIAGHHATMMSDQMRTEAETVTALGMREASFVRWQAAREKALEASVHAGDVGGTFTSSTKAMRLLLQSAMLGLGAYLVLQDQLSPGAMIAGSILLGRALAPIELALGQWPVVMRAQQGWQSLSALLGEVPEEADRTALPKPKARLEAKALTVIPPGEKQATLRSLNFRVGPGQAVGVIGPSGAGKSTLARALTGVWRPAGGSVRLDGASLDQYAPDVLGQHIGYLPQRIHLFDGTIAENIARMSGQPDAEKVVAAARMADAHEMIVQFPDGYDTRIQAGSSRLSGGQMQRIGLARALFGDPVIVVLDEPNSNLDNDGSVAVNQAIRTLKKSGKSVLIMAHRPAAIQECDLLLVLENGALVSFGPKDDVLKKSVKNYKEITTGNTPGGVS